MPPRFSDAFVPVAIDDLWNKIMVRFSLFLLSSLALFALVLHAYLGVIHHG